MSPRLLVFRLLAILGIPLLLLAGLEGALRWILGPPPPGVEILSLSLPQDHWFSVGNAGVTPTWQKDRTFPPFPASTPGPRLGVLGASSVYGSIEHPQSFAALLQDSTGFPVVNLGGGGLDSHSLLQIIEEMGDWRFDLLILYAGHNDFGNLWFDDRYTSLGGGLAAHAQAYLGRFQLYSLVRRPVRLSAELYLDPLRPKEGCVSDAQIDRALLDLEANLRRMTWLAERRGSKFILVTPASAVLLPPTSPGCGAPSAGELYAQGMGLISTDPARATALLQDALDADGIPLRPPTRAAELFRRVATEEGAILVDAERNLPREPGLDLPAASLFRDPVHFTAEGHRAMERLLTPVVQRAL